MAKLVIPGSIYSEKKSGKLIIKIRLPNHPPEKKVKPIFTGLDDTPANRRLAEDIKKNMYLTAVGLGQGEENTSYNIRIKEAFDEFLKERKIHKQPGTVRNDDAAYKAIVAGNYFLNDTRREGKIEVFRVKDDCDAYLAKKDLSAATKDINLRAFKVFLKYCVEKRWIRENPLPQKYKVTVPEQEIKIFTPEEVAKIIAAYAAQPHPSSRELGLLIRFLCHTGYRIHEALDFLKSKQLKKDHIRKMSKDGKREKKFPLTDELKKIFSELERLYPKRDKLFSWAMEDYSHLNRSLKNMLLKLDIEKDGRAFHEFRKTAISKLANAGVDILTAAELMDCSVEVMRKYYIKFDMSKLTAAAKFL